VDDVLPLSKPITLTNGKVINELPISKGQKIVASVLGYNRLGSNSFYRRAGLCADNLYPLVISH
jgi:hypothetical protein